MTTSQRVDAAALDTELSLIGVQADDETPVR